MPKPATVSGLSGFTSGVLAGIVPDWVVVAEIVGDDPGVSLLEAEVEALGPVAEVRRREFTSGRTCARDALVRLGAPAVPILRGPCREPVWPPGIVGSITHCRAYSAAVVAHSSRIATIGIDAEVHYPLPRGVLGMVATPEETPSLARMPETGIFWDRILFSAKESIYKAWFQYQRAWLGFEDAVVQFDPERGSFSVRLRDDIPSSAQFSAALRGRFAIDDGIVVTVASLSSDR